MLIFYLFCMCKSSYLVHQLFRLKVNKKMIFIFRFFVKWESYYFYIICVPIYYFSNLLFYISRQCSTVVRKSFILVAILYIINFNSYLISLSLINQRYNYLMKESLNIFLIPFNTYLVVTKYFIDTINYKIR